jgi:hypothetical protein
MTDLRREVATIIKMTTPKDKDRKPGLVLSCRARHNLLVNSPSKA